MSSNTFHVVVIVCGGVAFYSAVRIPHWLLASMNRGTLWRLRDCVFDARRKGFLPDTREVDLMLQRVEAMIIILPSTSALQMWFFDRRVNVPSGEPFELKLVGGSSEQQRYFLLLQDEMKRIVFRQYLLCSWSGILFAAPRHIDVVRRVLRRRDDLHAWKTMTSDIESEESAWSEPQRRRYQVIADSVVQAAEMKVTRGDLISAAG